MVWRMFDATAGMVLDTMIGARISVRTAVEKTSDSTFGRTLVMTSVPVFETMIRNLVGEVVIEAARGTMTLKMHGTGVGTLHSMTVGRTLDATAVRMPHLMIGGAIFMMIQRKIDMMVSQDYPQEVERRHDGSSFLSL